MEKEITIDDKNAAIALMLGYVEGIRKTGNKIYRLYSEDKTCVQHVFEYQSVFYRPLWSSDWNYLMNAWQFLSKRGFYLEIVNDSVKIIDLNNPFKVVVFDKELKENLFEAIYLVSLYLKSK